MPRRRVLTGAQLESLLALPATEDDLVRQWTLSGDDLATVGRRRRNHNQLGFALQLCVLRYPGRLLRPGELIPESALRFVADQLGTTPEALTTATRLREQCVSTASVVCATARPNCSSTAQVA
jgi:TnpA family transposase